MKKFIKIMVVVLALATLVGACFAFTACNNKEDEIVVFTNPFFAPFEYMTGANTMAGVDIDIMNMVGEEMGKKVKFESKEFNVLIGEVQSGALCDAAAAGITITAERAEKVDFSIPYYTANQYVIFKSGELTTSQYEGVDVVFWSALAGKKVGVQQDTTGNIYVADAIEKGALKDTGATCVPYQDGMIATDAIGLNVDAVVIDELPAKYFTSSKDDLVCLPLYYEGAETDNPETEADETLSYPTSEQYAIAINKNQTELKAAINKVLQALLDDVKDGKNGVERLVEKHFGLEA